MKNPKTYFQKYNKKGFESGREAINASHPILISLVRIINEQQHKHFIEGESTDLSKYRTIWVEDSLFDSIPEKYYGRRSTDYKRIEFFVGTKYLPVIFKKLSSRDQDMKDIEEELKKKNNGDRLQ